MAKFKVGQKVVCVDNDEAAITNDIRGVRLKKGSVYTVKNPNNIEASVEAFFITGKLLVFISLEESGSCWWKETSFEPLIEDTDHSETFVSNKVSRELARESVEYNPMEVPEHLIEKA